MMAVLAETSRSQAPSMNSLDHYKGPGSRTGQVEPPAWLRGAPSTLFPDYWSRDQEQYPIDIRQNI